jgi:hypothetical protein
VEDCRLESDERQVERGRDTTWLMECMRRTRPTTRYPWWSTGALREKEIQAAVRQRRAEAADKKMTAMTVASGRRSSARIAASRERRAGEKT